MTTAISGKPSILHKLVCELRYVDGKLKVEIHHIRVWIDDVGADRRLALQIVHGYGYRLVVPK